MTVDIKVDLEAGQAYAELAELEVLLKSMGSDMDSVEFDFGDFDVGELADEIDDLVDGLERADKRMKSIGAEIRESADALKDIDGIDVTHSSDDGGGGGSNDKRKLTVDYDGSNLPGFAEASTDGGRNDADFRKSMRSVFGTTDFMTMGDDDILDMAYANRKGYVPERNFGLSNIRGDYSDPLKRIGVDTGAGMEPASMWDRRGRKSFAGFGLDHPNTNFRASQDAFPQIRKKKLLPAFQAKIFDNKSNLARLSGGMDDFEAGLSRVKPTIGKIYQFIALMLPMAIALGTQLAGVAAAMGSLAIAGGAVVGLGLLGHANSLSGSMREAKQEVNDLKQDLFEVFSPTMQEFAPFSSKFLDQAPEDLGGVAQEMSNLTQLMGTGIWLDFVGGVEEFFAIINRNKAAITDLSKRFGGLIGAGVLNLFEWLLVTAANNQRMMISLGEVIISIAVIIYNTSMAVGRLAATFNWLFQVVAWLSQIFNTKLGLFLLMTIGYTYVLAKATLTLSAAYTWLKGGLMQAITWLTGYEATAWSSVAATVALAAALAAVTFGVSALAGGVAFGAIDHNVKGGEYGPNGGSPSFSGGGSTGAGGPTGGAGKTVYNNEYNYQMTNRGPMDNATEQRFRDEMKRSAMKTPEPEDHTSESQTEDDAGNGTNHPTSMGNGTSGVS